jgi:hypothetical protein
MINLKILLNETFGHKNKTNLQNQLKKFNLMFFFHFEDYNQAWFIKSVDALISDIY